VEDPRSRKIRRSNAIRNLRFSARRFSVLEGGYNLAALALSVEHHLRALIESAG
jgi:hypothetical protein